MTDVSASPGNSNVASATPDTMSWDSRARRVMMIYLPLACFVLILLFPFYWMAITSFKPNAELLNYKEHNPFWISSPTIAQYKRIEVLDFKGAHVTSESLSNVAGLEQVGTVLLILCDVQDEDLIPLKKIGGIRILCLKNTKISDAAIDTIAKIPGLERVDFSKTLVTPQGIERLRAARPAINTDPLWP